LQIATGEILRIGVLSEAAKTDSYANMTW